MARARQAAKEDAAMSGIDFDLEQALTGGDALAAKVYSTDRGREMRWQHDAGVRVRRHRGAASDAHDGATGHLPSAADHRTAS